MRFLHAVTVVLAVCALCALNRPAVAPLSAQEGGEKPPAAQGKAKETDAETKDAIRRFAAVDQARAEYARGRPERDLADDETYAVLRLHLEKAYMAAKYYRSRELLKQEIAACEAILPQLGKTKDPFKGKQGFLECAYLAENDGSSQPYLVYVPTAAAKGGRLPLLAFLHGYAGDLDKVNWIQYMYSKDLEALCEQEGFLLLMPFGRSNTEFMGVGEADVLKTLALMKQKYPVDEDRVFLSGASMGGSGTWTIGCHYPHLFTGLMTIAGRYSYYLWQDLDPAKFAGFKRIQTDLDYAEALLPNLANTSAFIFHGDRDFVIQIAQSREMFQRLKNLGCDVTYRELTDADHWIWGRCFAHADYVKWLQEKRRNPFPRKVLYQTYSLKYNRAYWVAIERIKQWGKRAAVDVEAKAGNRIVVKTENVAAMTLSLSDRLVDMKKPVTLDVDGATQQREIPADGALPLVFEKVKRAEGPTKTPQMCGPVRDAYLGPILFVTGTSGPEEARRRTKELCEAVAQEWATFAAGQASVRADEEVKEDDIAGKNLILCGGPEDNSLLKRIADKLPIRFEADAYVVGKHKFPRANTGLLMVYPNPLNPKRYVLINSGRMWGEHLSINHKLDFVPDFIVFTGDRDWDAMNRYLCAGYFDGDWRLDDQLIWLGADEKDARKKTGEFKE